jgi:hypothetical protein
MYANIGGYPEELSPSQGAQIGRIFASWAIFYFSKSFLKFQK